MVELTVLGISLQEDNSTPVLLLHPHGTRRVLSIRIGPMEAFAISTALHEEDAAEGKGPASARQPGSSGSAPASVFPRPLTHDLLLGVITALGGRLASVDIMDLHEGAFLAEAVLEHAGGTARVDCRPSDGIALALRCGAAIRASDKVVVHAESIDLVMAGLPEHVRTLAAAKLASLPGAPRLSGGIMRIPPAIEAALAAKAGFFGAERNEELVSAARKMAAEEAAPACAAGKPVAPEAGGSARPGGTGPREKAGHQAPAKKIKIQPHIVFVGPDGERSETPPEGVPQIRVTMVRHGAKGKAEILKEFHISAGGIPQDILTSLGLSRREAEAVNSASEEERWATLLRLLSPETKVPM